MKWLEVIKTVWSCQSLALKMVSGDDNDIPRLKRSSWNDREGWSADKDHLNLQFVIWSDEYGWSSSSSLAIRGCNTEPEIHYLGTSQFFYGPPRYGSGAIGVALFGLPTLVCYGLWRGVADLFTGPPKAKDCELSIRSQLVLERIRELVDDEEYDVVRRALIKHDKELALSLNHEG